MPDALSPSALAATLAIITLIATLSVTAIVGRSHPALSLVLCGVLFLLATLPYSLRQERPEWFTFAEPRSHGNLWLLYGTLWWLCAASVINQVLRLLFWEGLFRYRFGRALPRILADSFSAAVYLGSLFAIVAFVFDREITGLLATSGVIAVILGLAMQTTLSDLFSGVALSLTGAVSVGDFIDLGDGLCGRVVETSWRATRIVTRDSIEVTVPNGQMARTPIRNHSRPRPLCAGHLEVDLDPSIHPARARQLLSSAAVQAPSVLDNPEPQVRVAEITEGAVRYDVQFWCQDFENHPDHVDEVATAVCDHLAYAGVDLTLAGHRLYHSRAPTGSRTPPLTPEGILQRHPLFRFLDTQEIHSLGCGLTRRRVPEGASILQEDDEGDSLFLVAEGILAVHLSTDAGREHVGRLGPGDFFGEMSLLTGQPRSATVVAETPAVVFEVTKQDLQPILAARPAIVSRMSRVIAERELINEEARSPASEDRVLTFAEELRLRVLRFFHLVPRSHTASR